MANIVRLSWSVLSEVLRGDNVPFAYVLLKGWTALFGEGEWALRSLSVAAYSAAVVLTGLAGRRVGGPTAGLMAATLMATSTKIGLAHAATARPYALLALIASAAMLQSVAMLQSARRERARVAPVVALALTHLLGLFTHPTYVFVLVAYGAASTLVRRALVNAASVAALIAVAAYGTLWGPVVRATLAMQATSWMSPPSVADLKAAYLLLWGTGPGLIMLGVLAALLLADLERTREAIAATPRRWALVAAAVAWGLPIAVSFWKPVFLASRTPVMLLPASAVLLGAVLSALARRLVLVTLAALFVLTAALVAPAGGRSDPVPTPQSVREVLDLATCGDTIVATGLANSPIEYYLRRLNARSCVRFVAFPASMRNWTGRLAQPAAMNLVRRECRELVEGLAGGRGRVWAFVLSRGTVAEASAMLSDELHRALSCTGRLPLRGAYFDAVLVCKAASSRPF